ncbi:hypothetical protein ASC63_06815 [Leifsonia sp. Root112D2]|nr:hypothetical protein ASC63_06815 [Leifsonia sp. Root112D2]
MSDAMTNPTNDDTPAGEKPTGDETPNDSKPERQGPTKARITMWIVVGAVALYFIGNGLYGILTK